MTDLYGRLYRLPVEIRDAIELRYDGPIPEEAVAAGEARAVKTRPAAPDAGGQLMAEPESTGCPWKVHGIAHTSASSLNKAVATLPAWALSYLYKIKEPMNPAIARGIASEDGVAEGVRDHRRPIEDCVRLAQAKFDRLMMMSPVPDDKKQMERKRIEGTVTGAIDELRKYGTPTFPEAGQQKISIDLDGVTVPTIGYLDFYYPDHGLIIDLKTVGRATSSIPAAHARQGAIYAAAHANHEIRFAYASPKSTVVLRQEDTPQRLDEVTIIAQRLQKWLSQSPDRDVLAGTLIPDYSSFYWSSPVMRAAGKDVFGF